MLSLLFAALVLGVVASILAIEGRGTEDRALQPAGLLRWMTSGNWPAKVGGALLIVGIGALLRYALVNLEVPPALKLSSGVLLSAALALASSLLPAARTRRAVSLALGGAAFGVAYLTAYSAFALFNYLSNPLGLALLGLTAVATASYAVRRSALSLAVLSMVGAFLAPAFATDDPGPSVVYGYYTGASLLALVMVALRGWRPLVHLSFLFTLAGGVLFAWTRHYYTPAHAAVMQPMLLLLTAIHVAMSTIERRGPPAVQLARFDAAYAVALPLVVTVLAAALARSRVEMSGYMLGFSVIWGIAAAWLRFGRGGSAFAEAIVAVAFLLLGVAARYADIPWALLLLVSSVCMLWVAARRWPDGGRPVDLSAGLVAVCGALYVISTLADGTESPPFRNLLFAERLVSAALILWAGVICRRVGQPLDALLVPAGIAWALAVALVELLAWDFAQLALALHWILLVVALLPLVPRLRAQVIVRRQAALALALFLTGAWAATTAAGASMAWGTLCVGVAVLIVLAVRSDAPGYTTRGAVVSMLVAPALACTWAAAATAHPLGGEFAVTVGVLVAILVLLLGARLPPARATWLPRAAEVYSGVFAITLGWSTLIEIVRSPWAVTLEFACLAGLLCIVVSASRNGPLRERAAIAFAIGLALVMQAGLLRAMGPPGPLSLANLDDVRWPAVVSLLWAVLGAGLTLWSRRSTSRLLWVVGASLLVASAVKLLLRDFGSLGQLANILALIAAGAVFLLVGWVAPMPPAAPTRATDERAESSVEEASTETLPRAYAVMLVVLLAFAVALSLVLVDRPSSGSMWVAPPPAAGREVDGTGPEPDSAPAAGLEHAQEPACVPVPMSEAVPGVVTRATPAVEPTVVTPPTPARAADAVRPAVEQGPSVAGPGDDASSPPTASVESAAGWRPEPTVAADGSRRYTDYSLPQRQSREAVQSPVAEGEQGLVELQRSGCIRPATQRDVRNWALAANDRARLAAFPDSTEYNISYRLAYRTWVVNCEITIPAGLYGAHSVTFIVPKGVPSPLGNPGHSTVLVYPED